MASHWVVKNVVIGLFGIIGANISYFIIYTLSTIPTYSYGRPASKEGMFLADPHVEFYLIFGFVFLGTILGGYGGYKFTRIKDK